MGKRQAVKRAVGIVRVSRKKGREGDSFRSPEVQRDRIEQVCAQNGWTLDPDDVFEEMDVSGVAPLDKRPGLLQAAQAVEAKRASVVVAPYFDRLVRDSHVRDQFVDWIEREGGEVWTADMGRTSNGSAAERFTGGVLAQAARFVRDSNAEKARAAQVEAVEQGVWMSPAIPPGYLRGVDRRLTPDPELEPVVVEAFKLRAGGATIDAVRAQLAEHGIERTRAAVAQLLRNRVYLGELHFGSLRPNLEAHPEIVDGDIFKRVQGVSLPRGRMAKSDQLLARLGVLRCATCNGRMSVTTSNYAYRAYRCGDPDCPQRVSISAALVEQDVVEYVKLAIAGITESAHADATVNAAAAELERAEQGYEAFVAMLDPARPAEAERLREERGEVDAARQRLEDARASLEVASVAVSVEDWDELSWDAKRQLIRTVIERVVVRPGRGPDKVEIEPRAL